MKVFDRPNAAMRAYERRLASQPATAPLSHPVPTLWERARDLFKATVETIGSALRLAFTPLSRAERRDILLRLEPVEKLVRALLLTEAITFLLMTPQGLRLRHETPPCAIPEPPKPVGQKKPLTEAELFRQRAQRAMQTIAALRPKPTPEPEPQRERTTFDAALASCTFRVLRWAHEETPAAPRRNRSVWLEVLPPLSQATEEQRRSTGIPMLGFFSRKRPPPPDPESTTGSCALARRIAALARILDNPAAAIRRLAQRLASLPRDCFDAPYLDRFRAARWLHGHPECANALTHVHRASRAWSRTEPRLEPG